MPLTMAKTGETNTIRMITGKDELRRHLEELGLTAGERVTVVSEIAGNMILLVRESRIAIAKTVASRIMI